MTTKAHTREHQAALVRQAQAGSIQARNQLIEENIGLLYSVINGMNLPRSDADEHLSVAVETFIRCINAFDPDKGYALSTYSARSIQLEVYRQYNSNKGPVRVPEMDKRSNASRREFARIAHSTKRIHADMPLAAKAPSNEPREQQGKLWAWVADLPDIQREIIQHRLNGLERPQIASVMGLTQMQVKAQMKSAVQMLRARAA